MVCNIFLHFMVATEKYLGTTDLRCHPGIFLVGLRKTTKHFSQDYWYPGRNFKPGSKYEAGALNTRL
jgi:hypothetical protein